MRFEGLTPFPYRGSACQVNLARHHTTTPSTITHHHLIIERRFSAGENIVPGMDLAVFRLNANNVRGEVPRIRVDRLPLVTGICIVVKTTDQNNDASFDPNHCIRYKCRAACTIVHPRHGGNQMCCWLLAICRVTGISREPSAFHRVAKVPNVDISRKHECTHATENKHLRRGTPIFGSY